MLGDDDNACQAAVVLVEDRVGFMERMLYTAQLNEKATLIHNDYSHFVLLLW
jgi:hypothetical protein